MTTPFLGLRTVVYHVDDLEKAKAWYSSAFGAAPYFDEPFYVGFEIGGYELGLVPAEAGVTRGTGVVTYWGVRDIDAEYQRLLDLGARPHEAVHDVGGDIEVGSVFDPFGNVVGLILNPHFKGGA